MSRASRQIRALLAEAQRCLEGGRYGDAEPLYLQVLEQNDTSADALQGLVIVCLQTGRVEEGERYLARLSRLLPGSPQHSYLHANVLLRLGRAEEAIAAYNRLLSIEPNVPEIRYNFAQLLRHAGRPAAALDQYRKALDLNIAAPEEVHSNMGVILGELQRHTEARRAYETALQLAPGHIPALYNLGLLHEELGDWDGAGDLFRRILALQPDYDDARCRLAHGSKVASVDDAIIDDLQAALLSPGRTDVALENLHYALGKAYDDCGAYEQAFAHYQQGNRFSARRVGPYDRAAQEALVSTLIEVFDARSITATQSESEAAPIFVCGMFRSGSTLLEQMLAAHPALQSGGELDFFNARVPLPGALAALDAAGRQTLGEAYLDHLDSLFPGPERVIDKRPDNFVYLGLIRTLFPNARFIVTRRDPLDNGLSVYFQQLGPRFAYANDLTDIGHYFAQYTRLMQHWRECFPESLVEVAYEQVVSEPRTALEPVLSFLGLDWDDRCLAFYERDNRVRTASVWQVRQPLYLGSSGRSHHYEAPLEPLRRQLAESDIS